MIFMDLIFIPALSADMKTAVEMNKDVIPWVVKHYKAFWDIFKRITGLTPIEYRNKYNRQVIMA